MSSVKLDETTLANVPVFPLPHVVLFPEARLPLHVFEPRYRRMLSDCLAGGGTMVVAQLDRTGTRMAGVAGVGVVVEHQRLPDGRSNIVVAGAARVRLDEVLLEEPPRYPYKRARTSRLESVDARVDDTERTALLFAASMFAAEVKKHDPSFAFQLPGGGAVPPAGILADLCAFQLVVDAGVRQAILEELDPRVRVRMVTEQLAMQQGAMLTAKKGTVLN